VDGLDFPTLDRIPQSFDQLQPYTGQLLNDRSKQMVVVGADCGKK
jgi:hypothetical protein